MEPENLTSDKLNELMVWLMQTVKDSGDFVKEQAPEVAQQIATFGSVYYVACIAIGLAVASAILAASIITGRRLLATHRQVSQADAERKPHEYHNRYEGGWMAAAAITLIAGPLAALVVGAMTLGFNLEPAMKATFAPKVYVLEWVAAKVK